MGIHYGFPCCFFKKGTSSYFLQTKDKEHRRKKSDKKTSFSTNRLFLRRTKQNEDGRRGTTENVGLPNRNHESLPYRTYLIPVEIRGWQKKSMDKNRGGKQQTIGILEG